jgi:NTE family protein
MSITIGGEQKRIGLALSGGGFRAAAFHLGVFRKLDELKLLDKLDLLSCVSGGSIAGGFLAAHWGQADALDRLESYLSTRSIAVSSFVGGMLNPLSSRLDELADSYDRDLFHERTLSGLSAGPRIYINATNLATGNLFFFVSGGAKPAEMGEWDLGVRPAADFKLSRAVAASSAFPPVFPPLRLGYDDYPVGEVEYVTLSDGGIYDNLGVNPLVRDRNALDYAIASDAGMPFSMDTAPTESGSVVLTASIGILMEQVRSLQFKHLELAMKSKAKTPLWFSIDSADDVATAPDAAFASAIRTNLKRLSKPELTVLQRHAGALLQHRLATYAPELLSA